MLRLTHSIVVVTAIMLSSNLVWASTIVKLGFSTDSRPDFEFKDGMLSTFDDEFGATLGDQNTEVTFLGIVAGLSPIEGDRASFTLNDVQVVGDPTVIGVTLLQPTAGGSFSLYGPSNDLLLSGLLGDGTLSGPIGGPATGGFLTTQFGSFTGGSLLSTLHTTGMSRASFSVSLTDVNFGEGLAIDDNGHLMPFAGDATAIIGGQAPEPSGVCLLAIGLAALGGRCRRGHEDERGALAQYR